MSFNIKYIYPRSDKDQPLPLAAKFKLFDANTYVSPQGISVEPAQSLAANERLKQMFHDPVQGEEPELSICVLENCLVMPHGVIVTQDNAIVAESLFPYAGEPSVSNSFKDVLTATEEGKYRVSMQSIRYVEEPLFHFREHGEAGYFHWIHSVVPKLGLLQLFSSPVAIRLACRISMPFQKQTLDILGLKETQLFPMHATETVFCRRLYYATPLVIRGEFWKRPRYVSYYLRAMANLAGNASQDMPYIYISRKDAGVRRLENEEALMAALAPYGFKSVTLSQFQLAEQIRLMKQAKVILSAHGAGLANISFASAECKVIEIISPSRLWPTYRAIAARNGQPYGFVLANKAETEQPGHFTVDIAKVLQTLERMQVIGLQPARAAS